MQKHNNNNNNNKIKQNKIIIIKQNKIIIIKQNKIIIIIIIIIFQRILQNYWLRGQG